MARNSGAASGGGVAPPFPGSDLTNPLIIGDQTLVTNFVEIDTVVSPPDPVYFSEVLVQASDPTNSQFASIDLAVDADNAAGVADASITMNASSGGQVILAIGTATGLQFQLTTDQVPSTAFSLINGILTRTMLKALLGGPGTQLILETEQFSNAGVDIFQVFDHLATNKLFSITGTGALDLLEQTTPATPPANTARLFARDDGAGLTELAAIMPTGKVIELAPNPGYSLPGVQAVVTAPAAGGTTLFSTNAAPTVFSANELQVGDVIRIRAAGEITNNSGGNSNMQVRAKLGGQVVTATVVLTAATNANPRTWFLDLELVCYAVGAFATSAFHGSEFSNVSAANARAIVLANTDIGDTGIVSFATNAAVVFDIDCTSSVNNVAISGQLLSCNLERISNP